MKHLSTLAAIVDVARSGSVRKSAERLHLTPSALTRKIQDFERELGTPLFERTTRGMRLNSAGELLVQHARSQNADLDRVRQQIAALSGLRRGHVGIVCSQAFVDSVMPDQVAAFRKQFPAVSFSVQVRDHARATAELIAYDAELSLILQPPAMSQLQTLFSFEVPVCAIVNDGHPLATSDAATGAVRLRECLHFPLALPDHSLSVRHVLDAALSRSPHPARIAVESSSIEFLRNYVRWEQAVSFQVSIGIPAVGVGLCVREIDRRDLAPMRVELCQLRGRTLSIASTKFVEQLSRSFEQRAEAVSVEPLPATV